jgi:excinuclease UvrABC nuclease subunit
MCAENIGSEGRLNHIEIIHEEGLSLIEAAHQNSYKKFQKYILKLPVLKRSGVYLVVGVNKDGADDVLYVGGCVNLSKRLRSHEVIKAIVQNEAYQAFKVYSAAADDFAKKEARLIRMLLPKYNTHIPKTA